MAEAKLAASLHARRVASNAVACSGVGRSLTCTTSRISSKLTFSPCRRVGNPPRYSPKPDPGLRLARAFDLHPQVSAWPSRKEYDAHVRRHLWDGRFWSSSHFAASCAGAPLSITEGYVENQKRPN
ncbi:transposase [Streptosporangium sp. NPDC000396]|uniref:transposase n=1 Tax=Streptosporangium sp. NPDC000396 TaxID=3366185 RepID=UPI0036D1C29D